MMNSDKNLMTVKEYAAEQHISTQNVYAKIKRKSQKLHNHVFKINGKKVLDETAQEMLKPTEGNVGLIDKQTTLEKEIKKKENEAESHLLDIKKLTQKFDEQSEQLSERDRRIASLEQELFAEKAKTAEMWKRLAELSGISDNVKELTERLSALFSVLEGTANTGMGRKIGNLLSGKH